jgi:hypothetical protein
LGYWVIGLLGYWVIGLLGYWVIGLLGYWVIGLLGYWIRKTTKPGFLNKEEQILKYFPYLNMTNELNIK